MHRTHLITGLLAAAVLATAAGCGDDDKKPAALSKRAYVKQANAICGASSKKLDADVGRRLAGGEPTPAQLKTVVDDIVLPSIRQELKQLRALPAPTGDEETVEAIYDASDAALSKVKADPSTVVDESANGPFADANQKATAYGLTVCGAT